MIERIKDLIHWINERLERTSENDQNIFIWVIGFAVITTISVTIYAIGNPIRDTFFAHFLNISKFIILNAVLFGAFTYVVSAIFSFMYVPLPRIALASFLYTMIANIVILYAENSGTLFSYTIGFVYSLLTAGIIYLFILFFIYKRKLMVTCVIGLLLGIVFFGGKALEPKQWTEPLKSNVPGNKIENPAEKGTFNYEFYTYGSGEDIQRDWFGENVDEITPSVDASHFITKWGEEREKFWGFTQENLPLNGRLWLPEGDGPFPAILMVHGNHTMEYLSTSGYDYLGEQLASRGFIAISVDEDFINYSNIFGSPNRNYELRAWMMMQHLAYIQDMNASPDSILYNKVDLSNIGLMGHSRGGQAVAMVSDYDRFFKDFDDDELLEKMENVQIQGIVAIAPTDKSIDNERAQIRDVSYLLIHGARDADVNDFGNEKQFFRTTYHPNTDHFRASVYIEKANHTQFNSDWGRLDLSVPRGLFLNKKQIMKPEEQREVAKLFMTAFFERIFNKDRTFEDVFRNHYFVKDYLPDTNIVTKYNPASYRVIESFEDDFSYEKAEGFDELEITTPKHRKGSNRMRDALSLTWSGVGSLPIDVS
ncbi:MAG TPA: hypothetical protein VK061_08470, partial [Bacillota bacterium]|nr:hypothetical protein [Bacillota bacterium]